MEAVVLAGGFGTRLRQVVSDVPKPMAPVAGRPFLEILLGSLAAKGIDRVVLSVGYLGTQIIEHFGDRFAGMAIAYAVEDSPLGTGGGIRAALTHCVEDHVFIFNGDTFLDLEVAEVETRYRSTGRPMIVAREVPDAGRYGTLKVVDGRVVEFLEKGRSGAGLINAGCYVFPRDLLDAHAPGERFSLESDFLADQVRTSPYEVFVSCGHFIDIGIPEDFARAQSELAAFV